MLQLTREIGSTAGADSANVNLTSARSYQRKAQFLADFIEAENSMGFHADQEAARILAHAINYARLGQSSLRSGFMPESPAPDAAPPQTVTPSPVP